MTDAQLEDIIARGVPGTPMPAFAQAAGGDLTAAQVRILADGLRMTWRTAPASGPLPRYRSDDAAGDPARGREVFQSYCARCHGDDGAGGARGGSVVDEAFLSLTSDQALRTTIIAGRSDLGTPGWKDYAPGAAIDDQQISDVVAWLTSHRGHHE
jgi:mono/diheme cytochrome c family protein